jgi:hypothetical protein
MFIMLAAASLPMGCRTLRPLEVVNALDPTEIADRISPSNFRRWTPDLASLPWAEMSLDDHGAELMRVHNIRNFRYLSDVDYVIHHYDKTFRLDNLRTVDFIVVPFKEMPSLAHTMLSFGFDDDQYLVVSVEVRLEDGERYSPLKGSLRQYEITYIVADERDVIPLRTKHRNVEVFLYRTRATPEQARMLLRDVMQRVNKLAVEPEFYDSLTNNCTTNIVAHINRLKPGRIPFDVGVILPGYSDFLAYELGILDTTLPFEEARRRAKINDLANRYLDDPEFSKRIRGR